MFKVSSLYFHREGRYIIKNLSFEVELGHCLLIRGSNGVGKSTLLRVIAGFLKPHSGTISYKDNLITFDEDFITENIEYIGHTPAVKKNMSVRENIEFWNIIYGKKKLNFPTKFGLQEISGQIVSRCSTGQVKRLSLSRLELTHKKIWLIDEPTSAIDDLAILELKTLIADHCSNQGVAIVATHEDLENVSSSEIHLEKCEQQENVFSNANNAYLEDI